MVMTMQNISVQSPPLEYPSWLDSFINVYQGLSKDNLEVLGIIYHQDVIFEDPIHRIESLDHLYQYFKGLYQNLSFCDFIIEEVIFENSSAAIYWKMTYKHNKLNKGKSVTVFGNSLIKAQDNKVIYHRDYLDLGIMLYEQLPIIGKLIRWIKLKAAK
jgi:hypothetical protein